MIGDIARLVIKNLVAGIHNRPQRDVERFADANGHEDFRLRIVLNVKIVRDISADGLAQFQQAEIGCVTGLAVFERIDRGFPDVPRRREARLTNPERDDILH